MLEGLLFGTTTIGPFFSEGDAPRDDSCSDVGDPTFPFHTRNVPRPLMATAPWRSIDTQSLLSRGAEERKNTEGPYDVVMEAE